MHICKDDGRVSVDNSGLYSPFVDWAASLRVARRSKREISKGPLVLHYAQCTFQLHPADSTGVHRSATADLCDVRA